MKLTTSGFNLKGKLVIGEPTIIPTEPEPEPEPEVILPPQPAFNGDNFTNTPTTFVKTTVPVTYSSDVDELVLAIDESIPRFQTSPLTSTNYIVENITEYKQEIEE